LNWFQIAQRDWSIYHDTSRIKSFVEKEKITIDQYTEITDEPYVT